MPRLNTSLLQRPPPGNRYRQPSWEIGISKEARTSEPTMATVPAAARGPRYFTVPWRPRRLREALVEPGYEMREQTRRLGVEEPDHRHRRLLRVCGERRQKQDCEDERKDERGPDLHGTPPRRRWDAGTVGRQARGVKRRSAALSGAHD